MPTAREIMTAAPTYIDVDLTVADAAAAMTEQNFGALPVCNGEGRLQGVITDRDIVTKVIAAGLDPATTTVGQVTGDVEVVTIGADDSAEEAVATMKKYSVRRLPVIDGTDLVGMLSQADIARAMPDAKVGDLVGDISEAPANN
jgi:CBS domain-containing protein